MSVGEFPVVRVWRPSESGVWEARATIENYDSISFTAENLAAGSLDLQLTPDDQAFRILRRGAVTVDFRGTRQTYMLGERKVAGDARRLQTMQVAGIGALSMLTTVLAWPSPTEGLGNQQARRNYSGPAETVIRKMVAENLRDRLGYPIVCPNSQGRGKNTKASVRFGPILNVIVKKARAAGLTVDVGLVEDSSGSTRAHMTLLIGQGRDKTASVRLSTTTGTLSEWEQDDSAPKATRVIVGGQGEGAARTFVQVGPEGDTEFQWNRPFEVFQDRRDTNDTDKLTDAGQETLDEGMRTRALTLTPAETDGLQALRDYLPGDKVTAQVLADDPITEVVSKIQVDADTDNGVVVTPTVGTPRGAADPLLHLAQLVRIHQHDLSALETAL